MPAGKPLKACQDSCSYP